MPCLERAVPTLRPIVDVAAEIGLGESDLILHGSYMAKVRLDQAPRTGDRRGKYVVVTSISPTPFGEGKTTMAIGLAQGCWKAGIRSVVALRQPSLGPSFANVHGVAGCAILGDGRVGLILDAAAIVESGYDDRATAAACLRQSCRR